VRVVFVRQSTPGGSVRIGISYGEERENLLVPEADYKDAGAPAAGDNLTRDALEALKSADSALGCEKRALKILAFGDNSKSMLYTKLVRAGYDRNLSAEITRKMEKLGYIDEERQLRRLITQCAGKLTREKIIAKLAYRGYSLGDIKRIISLLLEEGEVEFSSFEA
jgi:SOS response regulatory protein OraA/RecX